MSHEALPACTTGTDIVDYFVEVVLTRSELATAADTWDADLSAFPVRA